MNLRLIEQNFDLCEIETKVTELLNTQAEQDGLPFYFEPMPYQWLEFDLFSFNGSRVGEAAIDEKGRLEILFDTQAIAEMERDCREEEETKEFLDWFKTNKDNFAQIE